MWLERLQVMLVRLFLMALLYFCRHKQKHCPTQTHRTPTELQLKHASYQISFFITRTRYGNFLPYTLNQRIYLALS
jgi:hypothetical protein